jgi:hypothetical protein
LDKLQLHAAQAQLGDALDAVYGGWCFGAVGTAASAKEKLIHSLSITYEGGLGGKNYMGDEVDSNYDIILSEPEFTEVGIWKQ